MLCHQDSIVAVVLNKRLCYGYSILPTLFDKIHVSIVCQWTVAMHGESAAAGRLFKDHD